LFETSKTPAASEEFYQMINGRFSRRVAETPFRSHPIVIFAAGAKNTGSAF